MKELGEELEVWRRLAAAYERIGNRSGAKLAAEKAADVRARLERLEAR